MGLDQWGHYYSGIVGYVFQEVRREQISSVEVLEGKKEVRKKMDSVWCARTIIWAGVYGK